MTLKSVNTHLGCKTVWINMCFSVPALCQGLCVCVHMVADPSLWPTGIVAMQMEALEAVHRESRRLPPIQKVSVALQLAGGS